jgi:hypothetical protein
MATVFAAAAEDVADDDTEPTAGDELFIAVLPDPIYQLDELLIALNAPELAG